MKLPVFRLSRNIRAFLVMTLWSIASASAIQAADVGSAESQFHAWLDAFNDGSRSALEDFQRKSGAVDLAHLDADLRLREMTGGFELKKVEEQTPTKMVALLKEKDSDAFARVTFEVGAEKPHTITQLRIFYTSPPEEFRIPSMSEHDAISALKKYAEKNAAADKFSGAVAVAKRNVVLFEQAYGMADRERKIPNTLETKFRMGSMNKMFTATAILQLNQAGKINLADPLGKYLTDYPNKEIASKVTLDQLLTHTGGTGDIFGPDFDKNRLELKTLQDYVNLYGQRGPEFDPGSQWEYSNYGFLLLGVIVEKVSGENYYDYVRKHIFKPAGMTSTDSLPEDQRVSKRAIGYMKSDQGTWIANTETLPYRGTSAGGGYTTVGDLLKFADALSTHKLLDVTHTALLTTGRVQTPMGPHYAYGFMDNRQGGLGWFGHAGGAPGMNGELWIFPRSGYVVTALSNVDPPAADRLVQYVGNRLPVN